MLRHVLLHLLLVHMQIFGRCKLGTFGATLSGRSPMHLRGLRGSHDDASFTEHRRLRVLSVCILLVLRVLRSNSK